MSHHDIDLGSRYYRGGSRLDPRGGNGQNTGGGNDPKNKYGNKNPYGTGGDRPLKQ